jgi:hypothetical protein
VSILRRLSTRRLLVLLTAVVVAAAAVGTIAVTALGVGGQAPPAEPLAQAIHDSAAAPAPTGVTARVVFTNRLFPSNDLLGNVSSALVSGAHGRLWATNDGRGRIELQSDAGDTQIVWSAKAVSVYDASSNTVYRYALPASVGTAAPKDKGAIPTVEEITTALAKLAEHANVATAEPGVAGGQPAYSVTVSPKENGGLVGGVQLGWDAAHPVPLSIGITAKGSSDPVLELRVTEISYGDVPSSNVDVAPPAGAKVVELSAPAQNAGGLHDQPVTGVAAVRAAVPFTLAAPATAGGRSLSAARLAGDGAILVYGHGLDSLVVHESAAKSGSAGASALGPLPKVTVGTGVSASELATPLATVLTFDRSGVAFVLGGSMTPADAEAAAGAFAA